ncbi:MAG TPA: hypothetical protein VFR58_17280 [Flavisolibacter sp.]|nr:hypothetical protein [Flavisolibacter sp.]
MKFSLYSLFSLLLLAACNSNTNVETKGASDNNTRQRVGSRWPKEDEFEFIDGCVEKAKDALGEDTAFNYCKCILLQVESKFDSLSSEAEAFLNDPDQVASLAQNCK